MIYSLSGIFFAIVQIKGHFCCTNLKTYVIDVSTRMKNRVKNRPAVEISSAGTHNNGIKGLITPIHSN